DARLIARRQKGVRTFELAAAGLRETGLTTQRVRVDEELLQRALAVVADVRGRAGRRVVDVDHGVEVEAEVDAVDDRAGAGRRHRGHRLYAGARGGHRGVGRVRGVGDRVRILRDLASHVIGRRGNRVATARGAIGLHRHAGGTARTV